MDDLDDETKKKGGACCCFTFSVTVLVLFIVSFKVQNEQDICFQYNTISKVVESSPTTTPGTKFLGFWNDILCYPKTVQKFEFSASAGQVLNTRTQEGLKIGIDVSVEYKFDNGKLLDLFNLIGASPSPHKAAEEIYKRIALSSIINTASDYPANSFLSEDRTNITTTMTSNVDTSLKTMFANVISLQMRNIKLDSMFVDAIDNILGEKIQQDKLLKQKDTELADAGRKRSIELAKSIKHRQNKRIVAINAIELEKSNKERQMIKVLQDFNKDVERANSDRINKILVAQGERFDATISRDGSLQRARNTAAASKINMQDLYAIEIANAEVKELQAAAEAFRSIEKGKSDSEALSLSKSAKADHFKNLMTDAGMSKEDIVRHEFLGSLEKQKRAKLFVGYKKVSMLAEPNKVSPLLKNIIP